MSSRASLEYTRSTYTVCPQPLSWSVPSCVIQTIPSLLTPISQDPSLIGGPSAQIQSKDASLSVEASTLLGRITGPNVSVSLCDTPASSLPYVSCISDWEEIITSDRPSEAHCAYFHERGGQGETQDYSEGLQTIRSKTHQARTQGK